MIMIVNLEHFCQLHLILKMLHVGASPFKLQLISVNNFFTTLFDIKKRGMANKTLKIAT